MIRLAFLLLALGAAAGPALGARIQGTVVDRAGQPVGFASVSVAALRLGVVCDEQGRFHIELPTGPAVLEATQLGYARGRTALTVSEEIAPLRIVLEEQPVPLDEVVVSASSFGVSDHASSAVVKRLDVYTTPGGAADLFQSLRALPGLNAPVEGAALYVRGGHPRETAIVLDGGRIGHPYHSEAASGGLFSIVDAYMIKSALFSSGGFSARHGGALSGVLEIESQDPLNLKTISANVNLVGGSASGTWALIPDRLSLIGSFGRSTPALLFRLYGSAADFESSPQGSNGFGRLLYRYSPTGRLALSYLRSTDEVAVVAQFLNVRNTYHDRTVNQFVALNVDHALGDRLILKAQASGQLYDSRWNLAPFGASRDERHAQGTLEAVWSADERHQLRMGADLRRLDTEIAGQFPADSTDYLPGAPTRTHGTRPLVAYPGFFVEDKLRVWGPLYATLGARFDYASPPRVWTADPRASLAWRLDEHQTLRLSTGRFHQLPDAEHLDPIYGNPTLQPLAADHLIAGYEWRSDFGTLRLEAYRKDYHDLVSTDSLAFFANRGHGYARGVDVFVQGTYGPLSGWATYGFLDTRRRELDDPVEAPAPYGARHGGTLIGRYRITSAWEIGARYHVRTGQPFTPVVGAFYDSSRGIWHPIEGARRSDRMPDFHRLDLRLTRMFSLPGGFGLPPSSVCVLYVEALNALGIRNVLDYVYNDDYTERTAIESYFSRRYAVAGVALSW